MRKRLILPMLLLVASALPAQQVDWNRFGRMLFNGEYKDVYSQAKVLYDSRVSSSDRLAAAYFMAQAASHYQEDAYDSSVARYRALLPELDTLERALCYAFLGSYDSALMYTQVLQKTPVSIIAHYCDGNTTLNVTPTAYDVIVNMMQLVGGLNQKEKVEWQRKLCAFHAKDNDDIRIWHDLRLLNYLNVGHNRNLTVDTIQAYINKYRSTKSQNITQLYYLMASKYYAKDDFVRALACCDTVAALAPKSIGGVDCANMAAGIKGVRFDVEMNTTVYPGEQTLLTVEYWNTDHLWFRVIPYYADFRWGGDEPAHIRSKKPVVQWDLQVPTNSEYRRESCFVSMPALKTGHYILVVSPTADFKKHGLIAREISCTDMQLVECGQDGLLLDRKTGRPIVGQEVKVMKIQYRNVTNTDSTLMATTRTDKDGRYHFGRKFIGWNHYISIDRDGYCLLADNGYNYWDKPDTSWRRQYQLRTDRPIYKPGDTMQVALLAFVSNGINAMAAKNFVPQIILYDPNYKVVATDSVTTDEFGVASTFFVLPKDRLPGLYSISVNDGRRLQHEIWVRVEEYKQPKFMVTIGQDGADAAPEFGKPYTVKGMAASYSAVPVSGAKVKYTVVRRELRPMWWRYGLNCEYAGQGQVASGETTTSADGSFEVTFIPEPDSNIDLGNKPCFQYHITVDVTDLNGESHPANTTVRVGYRNAFIALDGEEKVRTLDGLKPRLFDLNGNTLPGDVKMKIELLRQPDVPLFNPPCSLWTSDIHQIMSESEYRKAFPLYAYNVEYNMRDQWPVVGQWSEASGKAATSGVYRITLTADGADTVVTYRTVTTDDARKVQSQQLLWHDIDKHTAEVGDTVTLRFGSRFKDVEVYYWLRVDNEELDFRRVRINDQLKSINIVVDSTMLGGFNIQLIAVLEGFSSCQNVRVAVPFSHKQLDVEIATFRDKLQPGETEEWTIKVKGERVEVKEPSSLILTMYDDALNSYSSKPQWGFSPWRINGGNAWWIHSISSSTGWHIKDPRDFYYQGNRPSEWTLHNALPHSYLTGYGTARGESGMVTMQGNVRKRAGAVVEIGAPESGQRLSSDDIARMPGNSVESIVASVGGIGYSDEALEEEEESVQDAGFGQTEPQVRTNLNTLAFFVAGLRTDSTGTATYRFTVPELLTRWNVRGLAVTRDIKIGTLDRTLVTSKRLMVQPNMPRFLRSGDSLALMAKVVKSSDSSDKSDESDVTVTFLLTDAATGDTICKHVQMVKVKDAAQVMFDVEVPHNVYVATYEIVAQAEGMSDGERGQLPVLPSRQAVTVSQAMYINGVGEKTYTFSLPKSATAEPRLVYAEVVSNPIWLAVKCMPYLKTMENPSAIYLANQLYINAMGRELVGLVKLDKQDLQETASPLSMNEDVKQTLLHATPWVQDAESEEEQMAAVAHYFDTTALNAELRILTTKLAERQNADGGFSWMPEGRSSLWVTQQVLKMMVPCDATLLHQRQQALAYIDNEYQRDYERYIKPHLSKRHLCGATNIDYLYTRSFYGKGKTEAYKYYYANALKTYKEYENLYTQAQLALIFHRHGDHNAALDLLRRLKQKALKSDEMGMYWRDNRSGWWWYQRPIETQALIIQAFAEITPDDTVSIGQMQQWLLKQKQTTHWGNDAATTRAIEALLVGSGERRVESGEQGVEMTVFGAKLSPLTSHLSSHEGRISQRWTGGALDTLLAAADNTVTLRKTTRGIAWASVCYQFTDELENIPASETGITLKRTYLRADTSDMPLKVGDRIKVRIEISCDRAMDYLELIDGRPSCVDPLSTRAGWRWMQGLSYYITVNNTDTRCYIEHIDKGKYVFEYEVYVTNPGTFVSGPVTMQCMYAPEFRATVPAQRVTVAE